MRIARFTFEENLPRYAFVQMDKEDGKEYLVELDGYPLGKEGLVPTGKRYALEEEGIRLLAPIIPSKIYGVFSNYALNVMQSEIEKKVYLEPTTVISGMDDPIVIPSSAIHVNYRPQIGIVMGAVTKNVSSDEASKKILGCVIANDIQLADKSGIGINEISAYGFDTSTSIGPWIETDFSLTNAAIELYVNRKRRSQGCGNIANLAFPISDIVSYISSFSTLLPGDIILAGVPMPSCVSAENGDEVIVSVEGMGKLRNVLIGEEQK